MFKVLSTYICRKNVYKMQHLDGSGAWPSYIQVKQEYNHIYIDKK
jgi:hypothetical protein